MTSPSADPVDASSAMRRAGPHIPLTFESSCNLVLEFLRDHIPMGVWVVTRVENDRQTYLYVGENSYQISAGENYPWSLSLCRHMMSGAGPRIAPDVDAVPVYATSPARDIVAIGSYAGAPIMDSDGSLFGVICGLDPQPFPQLAEHGPLLSLLGNLLELSLSSERARRRAERESEIALTEATTDALTGVHNRRGWQHILARLDRDNPLYADPTVLVVIDLDNLKAINDGPGGHPAGDELLRTAARVMVDSVRDTDFVARIGGDEFGIVLADCPAAGVPDLADRIATGLAEAGVLASVGWAPLSPNGTTAEAVGSADAAMYVQKRLHRAKRAVPLSA